MAPPYHKLDRRPQRTVRYHAMGSRLRSRAIACAAALLGLGAARPAAADDNDLALAHFSSARPNAAGSLDPGAAAPDDAAKIKFRSLASQLGMVLAPKLLSPADTIGFGGFQFSIDF